MTNQSGNMPMSTSSTNSKPGVSVVIPVLNEEKNLAATIRSISSQNYSGEIEIILALGPSTDKTNQVATSLSKIDLRIKLVTNPSGKTPTGLNLAIKAAKFDLICRIDAHSEIPTTYISDAVSIMQNTGAVNVGGVMAAQGNTSFQRAVATALRSRLGVGSARFHIGGKAGAADTVYLGTFLKSALIAAGGFDENFSRAQDWELNYRLRKNGGLVWFDPKLSVTYRPRTNLWQLAKQYFQYGRWRRTVSRKHPGTVNFRYLAAPFLVLGILISILTSILISNYFLLPIFSYFVLLFLGSVFIGRGIFERLILPTVLATMHICWGLGFLTAPARLAK